MGLCKTLLCSYSQDLLEKYINVVMVFLESDEINRKGHSNTFSHSHREWEVQRQGAFLFKEKKNVISHSFITINLVMWKLIGNFPP